MRLYKRRLFFLMDFFLLHSHATTNNLGGRKWRRLQQNVQQQSSE